MKEIRYSIYFDGKGFYAAHQPDYSWSFTEDFDKAMKYKTTKGAMDRAGYADTTISYKNIKHKIVIEEIDTVIKNNVSYVTKTIIGEVDIVEERKKLHDKRMASLKKKYPAGTFDPLKNVIDVPLDDPFWD